jgi:hypothetical protein
MDTIYTHIGPRGSRPSPPQLVLLSNVYHDDISPFLFQYDLSKFFAVVLLYFSLQIQIDVNFLGVRGQGIESQSIWRERGGSKLKKEK